MSKSVAENIKTIKNAIGSSQAKLAQKINKGLNPEDFYSRDQIFNYENGRSEPDGLFKKQLAKLVGVSVSDIENKKLKAADLQISNTAVQVPDAGTMLLQNQVELMATQRVILSVLAEIQAASAGRLPTELASIYRRMVKDEAVQVREELKHRL